MGTQEAAEQDPVLDPADRTTSRPPAQRLGAAGGGAGGRPGCLRTRLGLRAQGLDTVLKYFLF